MSCRTLICEFGGESKLKFYIETESVDFNYFLKLRDIRFSVVAVSEHNEEVELSALGSSLGSVLIFGKSYLLPSSVPAFTGETYLITDTVSDISAKDYTVAATAEIKLSYGSEVFGDCAGVYLASVKLTKMYERPEIALQSERIALGSDIVLSGEMFSEGYSFFVSVIDEDDERLVQVTSDALNNTVATSVDWISKYPSRRSFNVTVRVSASYNGMLVPGLQDIGLELYLPSGEALPRASVSERFVSENALLSSLGYGVRNRSAFEASIESAEAFYGASVTESVLIYKGVTYPDGAFNTDILTEVGEQSYTVRITDSRGSVYTERRVFSVLDYGIPVFTAAVNRCKSDGTESKGGECVSISGSLDASYSLDGLNGYKFYYSYARVGSSDFSNRTEFVLGGRFIVNLALEPTVAYQVNIICEDSLGSVSECKYLLDSERVELNIAKNKVGIGKYAEEEYLLDCAWGISSGGDISFTSESGDKISLRELMSGGRGVGFGITNVVLESELSQLLAPSKNGMCLELVYIAATGLSYNIGWHVFLTFRSDETSGFVELSLVQ